MSSKVVPRFNLYKPPRLVMGKRWYIEYWYKIPPELTEQFNNKKWARFREFDDINKYRTQECADWLLAKITEWLDNGHSPFEKEKPAVLEKKVIPKWSLSWGLEQFIQDARDKDLRKKSIQTYAVITDSLANYFAMRIYNPIESFTSEDIEAYLLHTKKVNKLSNNTRNNYLAHTVTIFNYFKRKKIIRDNPAEHIEKLQVVVSKHRYYDDKTYKLIKEALGKQKPHLLQFCEFVYHTGTRPMAEARKLQVKHIFWDRGLLLIPGTISKNKKDDYIPMSEGLKSLLIEMGIDKAPDSDYIFSINSKHGKAPASVNYFEVPFRNIRNGLGIDKDYTIYSFKHTKAVHMAQDEANPYDIMRLFRHSGLDMTMRYLRDLGFTDSKTIHAKSRKF